MCDGFNHGALQIAVAQICQSMGWDAVHKSTHDLLTDVLQKYLEEIAKSAHGYCQQYSRTEPNLDDLNQAFQDIGVCLHELEDFVSQVDQVPFIHQLPRFPKPKPCALHHPRNGEIAERLQQYYDYLPPLVSKLLQNEDEEKAAAEDADTADTGDNTGQQQQQGTEEGFVRNEIKTVAEETSNAHVAVKRPHDHPPGLENETKKRRVELPFMQKGNRGNEMDILEALQGNLSSPSPTPSPDVWSTAKTFDIPSTSGLAHVTAAHPAEKPGSSNSTAKPKIEQKKAAGANTPPVKQGEGKPKSSPKKKVKAPKNATSPVKKSASPTLSSPTPLPKEKSPSLMKSPLANKKPATPETKTKTKTTPKKDKKPAAKAKKPVIKSPPTNTVPASAKENVLVKESMPKLIIKPIKKELNKEPQFTVAEFLPSDDVGKQEKPQQKKPKNKNSTSKKQKTKVKKEGVIPSVKIEAKEWSLPSTSEELKFSMSEFAVTHPPVESNVPGEISVDPALEHKKKKKKRKDKDKEKKKEKSKKLKTEPADPSQMSSLATPPIPRITVKLEPPSHSTSLTSKADPSPIVLGTASSHVVGSLGPASPKISIKQEPYATATVPKLTIKTDALERTVVSQTVSTTVVHGYTEVYYCPVCGDPDDGSFMIGCDGCDNWFHGRCVGIEDDPGTDADWFCSSCLAKRDKDSKEKQKKKKKKKSKEKGK